MVTETLVGASVYFHDHMRGILGLAGDAERWLPSSPVDVDEKIYVTLDSHEYYGTSEQPLEEFFDELRAVAKRVPKRYEAVITIRASYCFDDPANSEWEIGYWRDPTKRERAEREETNRKIAARDERRAGEAAEKERAQFERLKAKYSPDRNPKGGDAKQGPVEDESRK